MASGRTIASHGVGSGGLGLRERADKATADTIGCRDGGGGGILGCVCPQ